MMFHVPELARNLTHPGLGSTSVYGNNGLFELESCEPGWRLICIASDGGIPYSETLDFVYVDVAASSDAWEHVSVSVFRPRLGLEPNRTRVPTWKEMCQVKRLFWDAEDVVMQLHPAESQYVNLCPACLHLWRPVGKTIPTPPKEMVG